MNYYLKVIILVAYFISNKLIFLHNLSIIFALSFSCFLSSILPFLPSSFIYSFPWKSVPYVSHTWTQMPEFKLLLPQPLSSWKYRHTHHPPSLCFVTAYGLESLWEDWYQQWTPGASVRFLNNRNRNAQRMAHELKHHLRNFSLTAQPQSWQPTMLTFDIVAEHPAPPSTMHWPLNSPLLLKPNFTSSPLFPWRNGWFFTRVTASWGLSSHFFGHPLLFENMWQV